MPETFSAKSDLITLILLMQDFYARRGGLRP
jgi:hypothetical protein